MKKVSILLILVLLSTGSVFSYVWAGAGTEEAAVSAAKAWLSPIDEGRYAESWLKASAYFQGAVSQDSWEASLDGVRKPLGAVVSRRVKTARSLTELPGAPDGRYMVMEFLTSFTNKKSAVETVTFMLEKDGKWKAAGYFIR
jgi:hypothetical protein